jgi:hypothetical protein
MNKDKNTKIVWRPNESEETVRNASHPWIKSYFREENIDGYRDRTTTIDWVTPTTTNCAGISDVRIKYKGNQPKSFCAIVGASLWMLKKLHAHPTSS